MMPSTPPTFAVSVSNETSVDAMTPYRGDHPLLMELMELMELMDEDSGLGMKNIRCSKIDARRSLLFANETIVASRKRPVEDHEDDRIAPTNKRHRHNNTACDPAMFDDVTAPAQSPMSSITSAVFRLSTDATIADHASRDCCLPTIPGQHGDLSCVSPDTVRDMLSGCYDNDVDEVTIIDCRYPYEYEEGHIQSAINLYTKDAISQFLTQTQVPPGKRHVIIFHCEFSSKRGPKMYRFLRNEDRRLNADRYPSLNFPAVYLLDGGYKAFFQSHQTMCYPQAYKPMLHKEHKDDLRHFRVKSKSWAAGDKPAYRSRVKGVRLSF